MLEILIQHSARPSGVKLQHEMRKNKTHIRKQHRTRVCNVLGLLILETKVEVYRRSVEGTARSLILFPEDGSDAFLRNFGKVLTIMLNSN
jgi:hypothetical protein